MLLAASAANGDTLKVGIAGDEYLKPYGIVILFMSQAGMQKSAQWELLPAHKCCCLIYERSAGAPRFA